MAKKTYTGEVVSDKMDKTVVVAIRRRVQHPLYQKTTERTTRFKAHDEKNVCKVGDAVEIVETKPMSKDKRWAVVRVNGQDISKVAGDRT